MQGPDSLRRGGYLMAGGLALMAAFAWMIGSFWIGAGLAFAGMGVVGLVEYLAERSWRVRGLFSGR